MRKDRFVYFSVEIFVTLNFDRIFNENEKKKRKILKRSLLQLQFLFFYQLRFYSLYFGHLNYFVSKRGLTFLTSLP